MSSTFSVAGKDANPYSLSLRILCVTGFLMTVDRVTFPVVIEPIRQELSLTDTQMGLLTGLAFSAMYALASLPVARWADVGDRRTIIALSLSVWSLMTALCGLAQSVWQLFLARFGIGFGEAGSNAPVQSLICDYYPPERRSLPLSLFGLGAAMGGIVGYGLVGVAADRLGWRHALMLSSLPGLLVAVLIRVCVVEPRVSGGAGYARAAVPLREVVVALLRKRAFVQVCIAFAVWGLASSGMGPWLPAFFVRAHHLSLTQVGLSLGLVVGTSLCIGLVLGGWIGNLLLARDILWGLRLPALGMTLYTALTVSALLASSLPAVLGLLFVAGCSGGLVVAPLLATVGGLVSSQVRAVSLAVMGLLAALVGNGLGPLAVGLLSDRLRGMFGEQSLRYGLVLTTTLILWGVLHLHLASRHLHAEFEDPVAT
ncbi:MAG TPA: MFS transporter [Steroidobacteraceae bacterium]